MWLLCDPPVGGSNLVRRLRGGPSSPDFLSPLKIGIQVCKDELDKKHVIKIDYVDGELVRQLLALLRREIHIQGGQDPWR
jgi:hypothetical protein